MIRQFSHRRRSIGALLVATVVTAGIVVGAEHAAAFRGGGFGGFHGGGFGVILAAALASAAVVSAGSAVAILAAADLAGALAMAGFGDRGFDPARPRRLGQPS